MGATKIKEDNWISKRYLIREASCIVFNEKKKRYPNKKKCFFLQKNQSKGTLCVFDEKKKKCKIHTIKAKDILSISRISFREWLLPHPFV